MTREEAATLMRTLENVFDIVRLVDANLTHQCTFDADSEIEREPYECYAVWRKEYRCENCISAKSMAARKQMSKYEFVDGEIFFIMAKYVIVDGEAYVLEMVSKINDGILFEAFGKNEFIQKIVDVNRRLYTDSLTGCYNRRYYDEQLSKIMLTANKFALVDVDDFKYVNDRYGHPAGDNALRTISRILLGKKAHASDAVIRYGGDEFFLVFTEISDEDFRRILQEIKDEVEAVKFEENPGLRLTVSIGAVNDANGNENIFTRADKGLFKSKRTKNTITIN